MLKVVESDILGIETYNYPEVNIQRGLVRIVEGWFFLGLHPDEPACYMEFYFFRDGSVSLFFDRFHHSLELDLGKVDVPTTCQCYCECCREVRGQDICSTCLDSCMKADYPANLEVDSHEWRFPEKLVAFHPKTEQMERIFEDQVALVAYAQYKRRHIVSCETNQWLPWFAEEFSRRVNIVKKTRGKLTLKILVKLWMNIWLRSPSLNYSFMDAETKFMEMLEPILPFVNGEKRLTLVMGYPDGRSGSTSYLITEDVE